MGPAGVMDPGAQVPTEAGTPPGGTRAPELAHRARHGLDERSKRAVPRPRPTPAVIRAAADLVGGHPDRPASRQARHAWRGSTGMGLDLQPSPTRLVHTRQADTGRETFRHALEAELGWRRPG